MAAPTAQPTIRNASTSTVYRAADHSCNQVALTLLDDGELLAIFNEERTQRHADTGQTALMRSSDGGATWSPETYQTVLPYSDTSCNWDSAAVQLADGSLLMNSRLGAFLKKGIAWEADQFEVRATAYALHAQTETIVMKSTDRGRTWGPPMTVNTRPMPSGGCW